MRFIVRLLILCCYCLVTVLQASPAQSSYQVQPNLNIKKIQLFEGSIQPLNIYELTSPYEAELIRSRNSLGDIVIQDSIVFDLQSPYLNDAILKAQENIVQLKKKLHKLENWSQSSELAQARLNRNQAQMNYKNNKSHYKNSQKLLAKGIISNDECRNDKIRLFQAKKNYIEQKQIYLQLVNKVDTNEISQLQQKILQEEDKLAELGHKLKSLQVKSPITGVLLPEKSDQNTLELNWGKDFKKALKHDEVIARVAAITPCAITIRMNESDVARLHKEDVVGVKLNAFPSMNLEARILDIRHSLQATMDRYVAPKFDVVIEVNMDKLEQSKFLFGMSAKIEVSKQISTIGVVIPKKFIQYENNKPFCWVSKQGGIHKRDVKLGEISLHDVDVVSGLAVGDVVHTHA